MSRRRPFTRPQWPTWRRKRNLRALPPVVAEPKPKPVSTDALARSLVRRGLASPAILDDGRMPHRVGERR